MDISKKLKKVKISDIQPYKNNTKIHTQDQIDQIKKSIEKHGYIQNICVDKDNIIVIGHGRHEAMKQMGIEEIEVVDLSNVPAEDINKLRILDNKINESEWDKDRISLELKNIYGDVDNQIQDIMEDTGFDKDFIDNIQSENIENYDEDFNLPSGDKSPFGQVTFILSQKQIDLISKCIKLAKEDKSEINNHGNSNSNGNAIYRICKEWEKQKK
jgi:hypothetical protein